MNEIIGFTVLEGDIDTGFVAQGFYADSDTAMTVADNTCDKSWWVMPITLAAGQEINGDYLVAVGDVSTGFNLYGMFESRDEALDWANDAAESSGDNASVLELA